jgi:cysteinyl-tRNA synthetase
VPRFFNTLTRELQEFPVGKYNAENPAKIYTCGPTVYNYQHIGNFLAYVYWDVLVRLFAVLEVPTKRVMNITDVGHLASDADEGEDKMEKGAKSSGKTVWEVADFFADDFLEHFTKLNLLQPAKTARATDYIEDDMALVDRLTEKGYTYETSDGIYFDTTKFPRYADFARLDLAGLKAGKRVDFNREKRNVSDFALWKFVREGESHAMQWQYLGRAGYPGWHIECASIILAELGESIDIHTGGVDHIPVHHTNEIAEVESLTGKLLSKFWLHNNHAMIDGEKISKSLGNVILFSDLQARGFNYMDFKMWAYEGHYQKGRNFTWEGLEAAKKRLNNWRRAADLRHEFDYEVTAGEEIILDVITATVANNLSTGVALALVDDFISYERQEGNTWMSVKIGSPSEHFWAKIDELFGLNILESTPPLTPIQRDLLASRTAAREAKDFVVSDQLRDQLKEQGIGILDGADGQTWYHL